MPLGAEQVDSEREPFEAVLRRAPKCSCSTRGRRDADALVKHLTERQIIDLVELLEKL